MVYIAGAILLVFVGLMIWLVKTANIGAVDKEKLAQSEAESELRKKMAEVDASADVDNPLDGL